MDCMVGTMLAAGRVISPRLTRTPARVVREGDFRIQSPLSVPSRANGRASVAASVAAGVILPMAGWGCGGSSILEDGDDVQATAVTSAPPTQTAPKATRCASLANPPGGAELSLIRDDVFDGIDGSVPLTIGEFAHVVATFDSTVGRIYVNGTVVGSDTNVQPSLLDHDGDFIIGADDGTQYWHGVIDEVAVYDHDLAPLRVAARGSRSLVPAEADRSFRLMATTESERNDAGLSVS